MPCLQENTIMVTPSNSNLAYSKFTGKSVDIGDRIRRAREARNLSPTELARRMKTEKGLAITPQAIYQIESGGTKNPKPHTLLAIAEVLGVDMAYLVTGENHPASPGTRDTSEDLQHAADLMLLYSRIGPALRGRAYRAARQALIDVGRLDVGADTTNHRKA